MNDALPYITTLPDTMPPRATWIEVNCTALYENVHRIKNALAPSTRFMAVVKANGYGHDALLVSSIVAQAGADWLAVATPGEGLELRRQGIELPILILGYTPPWSMEIALAANLTLTVDDGTPLQAIEDAALRLGQKASVHVKVNTGMNRLGLMPKQVEPFLTRIHDLTAVEAEGIFTHFVTADDPTNPFLDEQYQRFQQLVDHLTNRGLRPMLVHAANSAATLYHPRTHFDMVRFGIALYGLHPDPVTAPCWSSLTPVLSWKAQVVHLTELQPGESVGYGQAFVATAPMTVATIPVGYADGFPRSPQNWQTVLLQGEEVPLVGRVCMDQAMVDISRLSANGKRVRVGDEVVLIGRQGERELTAEEIGRRTGTINYEVVSRILPRVPRIAVS